MIQTKITKDIYHGDGTTRRFEVTFDYNTKDNVKQIDLYTCTYTTEEGVTKYNNDVTKITSNYDFEVVNDVTYAVYPSDAAVSDGATPMASGTAIIIMRNTPNEQLSTGQYTSDKVEKQLDRLTMVQQELQEQLDRAYQAPEYVDKVNKADFATVANDIDAVNTVAAITEDIDLVNANAENITTVAQNIEDVNATGQNIEDVNTVALNINDVSTVAGISSDVTQVAGISTAVSNVSDNSSDVTLVSDNMASVMTTASSITDVQTVAGIATDVSAVADNNTNVTAVAGNATNINTVANKINKVETVADNISSINTASTYISDIIDVSDNIETIQEISENMDDVIAAADAVELVLPHIDEINNVSENINDIVTVAGINSDVSTVAANSSDISSVADNATNINTVASNASNIATAVSNMTAIIAAPTAATNAANSALNASTSATNAQKWAEGTDADVQPLGGTKSSKGWANRAQELVESIGTVMRYKGSVANYTALQAIQNPTLGDTYNVLDTGANYAWDGTAWDEIGSAVDLSAYRTSADQDLIDAGKVSKTGTETIAGVKTFSDGIVANVTGNLTGTASNATNAASATKATQDGDGNTISSTYIKVSTKGVASGVASLDSNTKVPVSQLPVMTGADGVNAGVTGSVPAPAATDNTKFLKGDGTWANPTSSSSWGSITGDLEDQTDLQNELDSKAPAVLLSYFWSDHIINEMSYLRGDTFSWQSGDVYTAVYEHLVDDIDGKTAQTETIGSYTITYYEADDGHKICLADQETAVQNIYNATGNARYFILDTTNTRFKLPRWKHNKYQAKAPVVGNGTTLGLTDGTNNYGLANDNTSNNRFSTYSSAYNTNVGNTSPGSYTYKSITYGITTDPTKSGIEATLEEDDMYLYFYVGTFTKTAYQETAGLNSELFNSKADLDLNNITSSDKVLNSLAADFTSSTTIAASNTFTAPSCGWINYAPEGNSGTSAILNQGNTGYIQIEGKTIVSSTYVHGSDSAHPDTCWAFIGKGQTCYHTMSAGVVYFYPCKGV